MSKQPNTRQGQAPTERFTTLRAELAAQLSEESALNKLIADNLAKILTA